MADTNFTTGPSTLPDIGTLSYNGCTFSPLFFTHVTSNPIKDAAKRTVKLIEHVIVAEGFVTLPNGALTIGGTMQSLYKLLTAQGGRLIYRGKALDIEAQPRIVGDKARRSVDVSWGPVPELIEFQPMGAGRSAKVSWKVTVRLVPPAVADAVNIVGLLQLNCDTSVTYDEEGYSSINIKGTMECPLTRFEMGSRVVSDTVDRFRDRLEDRILKGIDLGRFTITNRVFNISRDKRTLEFDVSAQEKPYMDLPPNCTLADGTFSMRPVKQGAGLATWNCTLRASYTVAAGRKRKFAWWAFCALVFLRMQETNKINDNPLRPPPPDNGIIEVMVDPDKVEFKNPILSEKPWIIDFNIDEGLYKNSRIISFSATWRLLCSFQQIISGSGIWRKLPEGKNQAKGGRDQANNLWAQSMTLDPKFGSIMGSKSWLPNTLDPKLDIIVDMGSTEV